MKQSYNSLVKRIQEFSMTCDIKDENGVVHHFHNGHEYVEIGGMKWATMNVGAEKPTDCGLYFAWGETKGYSVEQIKKGEKCFDCSDHDYRSDKKYNGHNGKTTLDAEDDGVAVNWGGKWRMPTVDELQTLGNAVNTLWTNDYQGSSVSGLVLTDKTDSTKELFFPSAGLCYGGGLIYVGDYGLYWSSSLNSSDVSCARSFFFYTLSVSWQGNSYRPYGLALRAICDV